MLVLSQSGGEERKEQSQEKREIDVTINTSMHTCL